MVVAGWKVIILPGIFRLLLLKGVNSATILYQRWRRQSSLIIYRHDITVILLKLALNTITLSLIQSIFLNGNSILIPLIHTSIMVCIVKKKNNTHLDNWQTRFLSLFYFKLHVKIYWEHCNMLVVLIYLLIFDFVSCHSILIYLSIFSKLSIREIYKLCMFHRR